MSSARVIFIHGPPACGKLTIGRELAVLSGLPLFHNHLTVDLLLTVFPFGSPAFVHHRERIWVDVMADAVESGRSLIFTFNPERTVGPDFPQTLTARVAQAGGAVSFVAITCSEAEIERRTEAASRQKFLKLNSRDRYLELKQAGAFDYPPIASQVQIDSTHAAPADSARQIASALELPVLAR